MKKLPKKPKVQVKKAGKLFACLLLVFPFFLFASAQEEKAKSYTEQENWKEAYPLWLEILKEEPCNEKALKALQKIGNAWLYNESKKKEEAFIFETLHTCRPKNPDFLYFWGRSLYQLGDYQKAKEALKSCLELAPTYSDATILLGYIAYQEGDKEKAKELFEQFPDNSDAKKGLALLEKKEKEPSNHLQKAQEHHLNLEYTQAEEEYAWLVQDPEDDFDYWPALFDIKSHTRPSVVITTNYTDAKEDDPDLRAPVVKDYYFLNTAEIRIPVFDAWRMDVKQIYYHQRENDIYPPIGVNYSAYSAGGELTSRLFFQKYWRWDLVFRSFYMWGKKQVNFPFQDTTRFEPGTTFLYNDGIHLAVLNAHRESYIIKNFITFRSKLLATDYLTAGYGYRFKKKIHVELEAWVNHIFIKDSLHNWKNSEEAIGRVKLPIYKMKDHFTMIYHFEHGHYDKLNLNYYSYKQQFRNTLGIRFQYDFTPSIYWDITYEHLWQTTYSLLQPIGTFIFTQAKQYLIGNRITSKIRGRYKDRILLELEGHYFYETLPYRDWNINGSFIWQF